MSKIVGEIIKIHEKMWENPFNQDPADVALSRMVSTKQRLRKVATFTI